MALHRRGPFPRALWATVRALWAHPMTRQVDIASVAGTSQAAVAQALAKLRRELDGDLSAEALGRYYVDAYPGPKGTISFWATAEHPSISAKRLTKLGLVVSGDPASAVLAPWRTSSHSIAYSPEAIEAHVLMRSGFVDVEDENEANLILVTKPADLGLFGQASLIDDMLVAHPLHVAKDLHRLGGSDRAEGAARILKLAKAGVAT